jgi:DUF1009 family protein
MRFDVPVIGLRTIENSSGTGATALRVTARKTLLLDRDDLIALADRKKVPIVGG